MTPSQAEVAKQLDISLSETAGGLYDLDNSADVVFVRGQADAGNGTAVGLVTSLGLAWERYALAKDAVDRLDAALAARDHGAVDELLGPTAVGLPDGTSLSVALLLEDIDLRIDHLGQDVGRIAAAARQAVGRLDVAHTAFGDLLARAGALGAADDVELTRARAAIDQATVAIAADPAAAADLGDLDRLLHAAADRVEALERAHKELPDRLVRASGLLHDIEVLVARGAQALADARAKIAAPVGLVPAVDLAADGDRALGPWLGRIRDQAAAGAGAEEEAASAALDAWQAAADTRLADARRVATANAAPLARRNELRGLLDAYRAKAVASGGDEDGHLARLHAAAEDVLFTAPCDLAAAENLVQDYVGAVNAMARGEAR